MVADLGVPQDGEAIERAFGAENRNRLIDQYFDALSDVAVTRENAWQHVYRMLLWSDPTTGLAHCYESDKSQPGKPWYDRSLAFHDWMCRGLQAEPAKLAEKIDWLFIKACADLANAMVRREIRLTDVAKKQREPYDGRGFPEPGADPELAAIIRNSLSAYLSVEPTEDVWRLVTQKVRQFLAVQNKRKNLVGEGFEDVLSQTIRRACDVPQNEILTRHLLYQIPGFNRAKAGSKENKVDIAIVRPSMRTLVTAKWSVRADREKQFPTEYEEYCNAQSDNEKFQYVFVTNEFDPARLMRACEARFKNNLMFDHVVHINTDGVKATYGLTSPSGDEANNSRKKVAAYIESGRLISLKRWLEILSSY
ncbi:hypothetical protein U1769_12645 [Sphingomonas sp. ZT3P38]|uniref:hypothetical protein n=1 Tax=Parasphingomonas zepuensis TaxID=3096161 RepID=UPI002FC64874